jgi:hypothetical protein
MGFIYGCTMAATYCFIHAIAKFILNGNTHVFFYHQYSAPIKLSAIYFSLFLLVALGYILLNNFSDGMHSWRTLFMGSISLFLFLNLLLLSSKMMIAIGVLSLALLANKSIKTLRLKTFTLVVIIIAFIFIANTENPIRDRYTSVSWRSYSPLLTERNFKDFSFDGLSIRIVLWRLGAELMSERKSWLFGIGGTRYHELLNRKVVQYELYAGNGTSEDVGYQNYNMHNQYMESYLQFGILGEILLITSLLYVFWYAIYYKHTILVYTVIIYSIAFLTESLLETQAGIILFTIIISGEWIQLQRKFVTEGDLH